MNRIIWMIIFVFGISFTADCQHQKDDLIQYVFDELNLDKRDLGYSPKTYWARFPQQIPYKMTAFDDLFAQPLKLYDYSRLMYEKTSAYLHANAISESNNNLSKLLYTIGISNQTTGFRGFIPTLSVNKNISLTQAIIQINNLSSESDKKNRISSKRLKKQLSEIPLWMHEPLAQLLDGLSGAFEYHRLAIRKVDDRFIESLFNQYKYTKIQNGSDSNCLFYSDLMDQIDEQSLYYASMLIVRRCEMFVSLINSLSVANSENCNFSIQIPTPLGDIIISDTSDNVYNIEQALLIIDLGGNDTYHGAVASTSYKHPISILIDFDGNDHYLVNEEGHSSQAAGILGTALLIDLKGNDEYLAKDNAQGFGLFGTGFLYDADGKDTYRMENYGQGCGYFGIGLNVDILGDDHFYLFGNGQGMGGTHGTGVLYNYSGNDCYFAEPDSKLFAGRADYHSKGKVNANFAQGAAQGRRADMDDGHSWAGGLGFLIDAKGNDTYTAGNFSQGIGYWFGTGILFDAEGDDTYNSVYFTQASAAHFAMGALIDRKGNDTHILQKTSGAGLAFGWDFCNALYVDEEGNDTYEAHRFSMASSMIRSNTFFIELDGNDIYRTTANDAFLGSCDIIDSYKTPMQGIYKYEANQIALFIEANGNDKYFVGDSINGWKQNLEIKNNTQWSRPDSLGYYNNYYMGIDTSNGIINFIEKWNK